MTRNSSTWDSKLKGQMDKNTKPGLLGRSWYILTETEWRATVSSGLLNYKGYQPKTWNTGIYSQPVWPDLQDDGISWIAAWKQQWPCRSDAGVWTFRVRLLTPSYNPWEQENLVGKPKKRQITVDFSSGNIQLTLFLSIPDKPATDKHLPYVVYVSRREKIHENDENLSLTCKFLQQ